MLKAKKRGKNVKDEKGTVSVLIFLRDKGHGPIQGNIVRQRSFQKTKVSTVLRAIEGLMR